MPEYKAPLRDMRFLIDEVFDFHGRYQALGASDATPDMVAAILDEGSKFCEQVLAPLNRSGDEEGCHFDNGVVTTPKGFKEAYAQYVEGLERCRQRSRVRRPGPAALAGSAAQRDDRRQQCLLGHVPGPDPRRHVGDPRPRQPGAEGPLPGADDRRHLDRHHVPDRAALRHRPGHHQDPRGAERRRQPCDQRDEDLHLRRRARPEREHRPPGAGQASRCAGRDQGYLAVHRAEVPTRRRR